MTELVQAIDSSAPYFPPPAGTRIILGYIGGAAATQVWTPQQVQAAHSVAWFAPIWVPPQGGVFQVGPELDGYLKALTAYGIPRLSPVFVDIEHFTWYDGDSIRAGIVETVDALLQGLTHEGYPAYAYGPLGLGAWLASWVLPSAQPTHLPDGCVGWQYADAGPYDLSIFTDDLNWWGKPATPPPPTPPQPVQEDENMARIWHATADSTAKGALGHPIIQAGDQVIDYGNGTYRHIPHGTDSEALLADEGHAYGTKLLEVSGDLVHQLIKPSID